MTNKEDRYVMRRKMKSHSKKRKAFESFKLRNERESRRKEIAKSKEAKRLKKQLMRHDVVFVNWDGSDEFIY